MISSERDCSKLTTGGSTFFRLGGYRAIEAMPWKSQAAFRAAPWKNLEIGGSMVGIYKSAGQ